MVIDKIRKMSVKGVKLKSESFFSIFPGVLELWKKNLRGRFRPPVQIGLNDLRPSPFEYFQENNFFTKCQSGFRKFHSTVTSLLKITNDWLLNMDKGVYIGVVYFDL